LGGWKKRGGRSHGRPFLARSEAESKDPAGEEGPRRTLIVRPMGEGVAKDPHVTRDVAQIRGNSQRRRLLSRRRDRFGTGGMERFYRALYTPRRPRRRDATVDGGPRREPGGRPTHRQRSPGPTAGRHLQLCRPAIAGDRGPRGGEQKTNSCQRGIAHPTLNKQSRSLLPFYLVLSLVRVTTFSSGRVRFATARFLAAPLLLLLSRANGAPPQRPAHRPRMVMS
jgi:hypothetical protein